MGGDMVKTSGIRSIHLWACDLILHDYLFFATARRGFVEETGDFIHNYSLTYALGWAKSEWYTDKQKPRYDEQLSAIKNVYVTPARLLDGYYATMPYNRFETENYSSIHNSEPVKTGYGIIKCFRSGSIFRFYIIAGFHIEIIKFIRLGRLMAKAEVMKYHHTEGEIIRGDFTTHVLLNWSDMAVRPIICDVIVYALPGRLIKNARFIETQYVDVTFPNDEKVKLPLEMGYPGNELCSSWKQNADK
jgi:CRISPR-associated protein Csc1